MKVALNQAAWCRLCRYAATLLCLVNAMVVPHLPALEAMAEDGREQYVKTLLGLQLPQVSAWGAVLLCLPLILVICLRSSISKQGKELAFIGLVLFGAYATSKSYIDATDWLISYTGNAACSWGAFIPAYVVTGLGTTLFSYLAFTLEDEGEEL